MRTILAVVFFLTPLPASAQGAAGTESRLKALEERLEKLEGASKAEGSLPALTQSVFNPAMGVALDMIARHADDKARFEFRTAELNISAAIDPFLKGWTIVNANDSGVSLEEAAVQTTSLPYNLTARAGRLFADLGRLGRFHDHELPVVDRPRSLDTFIGGETQADGVEANVLLPTPMYLSATLGAYNKLGAENDRQSNDTPRSWSEMTYLGKLQTAAEFGSDHTLDLGLSAAWTPKRVMSPDPANTAIADIEVMNTWRVLGAAEATFRWHPTAPGFLRGALWGTEVLLNNERRQDPTTLLPLERVKSYGGYSFVQISLGRRWRPGFMIDLAQDLDRDRRITRTYTAFVTLDVTGFQKLRASYARTASRIPGRLNNDAFALQWTAVLGRHVHGFRDR